MDWLQQGTRLLIILIGVILNGCLEPYSPPEIESDLNLLVVDGFLTANNSMSELKLSRSNLLSEKGKPALETGAQVLLEDSSGGQIFLNENSPGTYSLSTELPQSGMDYRLRIKTSDGSEYLSDFVKVKATPEIDSVYWEPDFTEGEIGIFVSTHDPLGKGRKYRWRFIETWEYQSRFASALELKNGIVYARDPNDMRAIHDPAIGNISTCWRSVSSSNILIGNSEKLKEDVISMYPLIKFPRLDERASRRYSILVEQYSISDEEYEYWALLKRNTENLGTLFDPLPTQIPTNIKCVSNESKSVLGYFSLYSEKRVRMFINESEVEAYFGKKPEIFDDCTIEYLRLENIGMGKGQVSNAYLLDEWWVEGPLIKPGNIIFLGYLFSSEECLDCRLEGGTTKKPSFW